VVAEKTVFLVDDDAAVRRALTAALEASNHKTRGYDSAKSFLAEYDPNEQGCLILDVHMPEMSGIELQSHLAAENNSLPIIFITGHGDDDQAAKAMNAGALAFLQKPFDFPVILDKINDAFLLLDGNG